MIQKQALFLAETPWIMDAANGFYDAFHQYDIGMKPEDPMWSEIKYAYDTFLLSQNFSSTEFAGFQPDDPKTLLLQYQYMVSNSYLAGDGDVYGKIHQANHPRFTSIIDRFGFQNFFIVDLDGYIDYSVKKSIDFATNLLNGPFKNSNIADAFRQIKAFAFKNKRDSSSVLVDFKNYLPDSNAPAAFIAVPIYAKKRWIGCLILQLSITQINKVMTNDGNWFKDGLGNTGETCLVGPDFKMRNDSRFLIETPTVFKKDLIRHRVDESIISKIFMFNTTVLIQEVRTQGSYDALAGITQTRIITDYRNIPVLSSYAPLNIKGLSWAILSEIDAQEAFSDAQTFKRNAFVTMVVLTLATFAFTILFSESISRGFSQLMQGIKKVENSDFTARIQIKTKDEFQEIADRFNQMALNLSLTTASRQELIMQIEKREQVEEALKNSEKRYRMIFENSVVGMYLSKPEGEFIRVNKALSQMLRYNSPEDLLKSISDISSQLYVNPEDRSRYQKTMEKKGVIENYEMHAKCKDGTQIILLSSACAYFDETGKVVHYEGVNIDITDRKRLEKEKEILISDLQTAFAEIKQLRGLLPLCSYCKMVRDEKGYWHQIDAYIQENSDVDISHSICPGCAKKYYPDYDLFDD